MATANAKFHIQFGKFTGNLWMVYFCLVDLRLEARGNFGVTLNHNLVLNNYRLAGTDEGNE